MTTRDKMTELVKRGYNFEVGPHAEDYSIAGFYAVAYRDCDVDLCGGCDSPCRDWNTSQHAMTVEEAIDLAIRSAEGEEIPCPPLSDFQRKTVQ